MVYILRHLQAKHRLLPWLVSLAGVLLVSVLLVSSLWAQAYGRMSFGAGQGIQWVDPDGSNAMPLWLNTGSTTIAFTLYPLTPAGLISQYVATKDRWWYADPEINMTGLPTATTWQQEFVAPDSATIQPVRFPTATVASGFYVIEAKYDTEIKTRALVTVGRHGLVLKRDRWGTITAWASRLQSGAPTPNMTVTIYDAAANVLAQGVTNAEGIAKITLPTGKPLLAIGQAENEIALAGLDEHWRSDTAWWYGYGTQAQPYVAHLHTERPIYRPGDTIYYNAVVRHNLSTGYTPLAANQPVLVALYDARSNLVEKQTRSADEFGSVAGDFKLGAEPPLGSYRLEIAIGDYKQQVIFRVEAYRKPEYAVTISAPADFIISGDSIVLTVAADYYFGQPVVNAQVKLQITDIPLYDYEYWQMYSPYDYPDEPTEITTSQEFVGVTDSNGRWTTHFTPADKGQTRRGYLLSTTVTDAAGLPVVSEKSLQGYWNDFALTARSDRHGYQSNEAVTVKLLARQHDNAPAANQPVTVRLLREQWDAEQRVTVTTEATPPQTVNTAADGAAQVTFADLPQGWYRLVASSSDGRGRVVEVASYLWIYDASSRDWWYWNHREITITPDKAQYAPGETATLLIQSRVQGVALLTLERVGVQREIVVPLTGLVTPVQIPITADLAPNFFAKLHIFKRAVVNLPNNAEGKLVIAQAELQVSAADPLALTITPNATTYKPGEQATLKVRVSTSNGQPVRARVSLAVVDEAIFALDSGQPPALYDVFYSRLYASGVATYDGLARQPYHYPFNDFLSPEFPQVDTPTAEPPNNFIPPFSSGVAPTVRRIFLDTAYWNPAIVTNEQGEATVTFALPDNLTTWRVVARAVTVDTLVGEAQSKVLVTQEIIARPVLPRFAVVGDRFRLGTVAQNFSGGAVNGTAALRSDSLVLLDPAAQTLTLPNGGSATAYWTAVAAQPGSGPVTTTLLTDNGQDVVELPLLIKPFAAPERWASSGQANPEALLHFTLPANAVNRASDLTVRLAPSIALGLFDGLEALIDYPYGCVEQTMSKLLPSAVAAKAFADLGIPNPKAAELPAIISQGLQKIYGYQHADGSWGWFYDDDGGSYLTAYVLLGLHSVKQAGFAVDVNVVERGFRYLESLKNTIPQVSAFALYVRALAGRGNQNQARELIAQQADLDVAGLAALILALELDGDHAIAQTVVTLLEQRVHEQGAYASWPPAASQQPWAHWQTMSSTEKNTAFALRALLVSQPTHPLLPKVVRWLMDHRNGAGWGGYGSANTQATAFVVLGLADYVKQNNEAQPNYAYRVLLNGTEIASGQMTPDQARQPLPPLVVPGDRLRIGENEVRIVRDSNSPGALYFSSLLRQQLFYAEFAPVSSVDQGLALNRTYRLKEGTARDDGAFNLGDVVEVTLHLTLRERMSFLHVSDPLPAGFEGIAERVNVNQWGGCDGCVWELRWHDWGYNRKDVRDDRVDFFLSDAASGQLTFTYLMRATTPGEFGVLPGEAYPMYNEAVWGRSASQQVVVAPEVLAARPALAGDFDRNCRVDPFDAQLLAGRYGTQSIAYNQHGALLIDLSDLVVIGARRGATCLRDNKRQPEEAAGKARFALQSSARKVGVGEPFTLALTLADVEAADAAAKALRGVGLDLRFNPNQVGLVKVQWHPALGQVLPLGPTVDETQGLLSFGAIDLPATLSLDGPLATITLVGRGVGHSPITVSRGEALDGAGRLIDAGVQGENVIAVEGQRVFLAAIYR